MLNQSDQTQRSIAPRSLKHSNLARRALLVLERTHSLVSSWLEQTLGQTLTAFEQELFTLAEQAANNEEQQRLFDTLHEVRRGRADIAPTAMVVLENYLANVGRQAQAPSFSRTAAAPDAALTLVDPSELEETLALQEIAGRTEIKHNRSLYMMGMRFAVLGATPALEPDEVPVGPHVLCECLRQAVSGLEIPVSHRVFLYRRFDKIALSDLATLFAQIDELFISSRILPHLEPETKMIKRSAADDQSAAGGDSKQTEPGQQDSQESEHREQGNSGSSAYGSQRNAGSAVGSSGGFAQSSDHHHGGRSNSSAPAGASSPHSQFHSAASAAPGWNNFSSELSGIADDGYSNPLTGWPGVPEQYPRADFSEKQDVELFDTLRDLLKGRRASDAGAPMSATSAMVSTSELQQALGGLQAKMVQSPAGAKSTMRSASHLRQDVLNSVRQFTPEGKSPVLANEDQDTLDLVGMLFDHLVADNDVHHAVRPLLNKLQIPLLRVALQDKSFFTRRNHAARQLLNAVAETGLFWMGGDAEDTQLLDKMNMVVNRVSQEYDQDAGLFEGMLSDLSEHLNLLARKSEAAERRHVDAAKGREKLELARVSAQGAIQQRLAGKSLPVLLKTVLEQAWTDVLALTILRQGEHSEPYAKHLQTADKLIEMTKAAGNTPIRADDESANELRSQVEAGLSQVGFHGEEAAALIDRVLGLDTKAANDDSISATEIAVSLKSRSKLGGAASNDKLASKAEEKLELTTEQNRILERLKMLPYGTWFEFELNQQGDKVRRKLSWFSPVTGRCVFVNQRGARTEDKALKQLAREIDTGLAHIIPMIKENVVDRALKSVANVLNQFIGKNAIDDKVAT